MLRVVHLPLSQMPPFPRGLLSFLTAYKILLSRKVDVFALLNFALLSPTSPFLPGRGVVLAAPFAA